MAHAPHTRLAMAAAVLGLAACASPPPPESGSRVVAEAQVAERQGVVIYRPAPRAGVPAANHAAAATSDTPSASVSTAGSAPTFEERVRRAPTYRVAESGGRARAADRADAVAQSLAERQARSRVAAVQRDRDIIATRENITLNQARSRRVREEAAIRRQGVLDEQRRRAVARLPREPRLAPTLAERTDALQADLQARGRPSFSRSRPRTRIQGSIPTYTGSLD
ncbi:MAG: hypothetical protein AAFU72_12745 [Pseudomonadota bacterium]